MVSEGTAVTPEPLVTPGAVRVYQRLLGPIQAYHRHRVEGLEHLPRTGGVLLVLHHTLATYDAFLLGLALYNETGRLPAALGDDLIFKTPGLKDWARDGGVRPASPGAGRDLLAQGHLVGVAPGGMAECLRPSTERYQHRWQSRQGFCRLALRAGVPMVLAACPAADDLFQIRASRVTRRVYRHLKAPLPIFRGIGPTWLPRPVQLTHYVSEPLVPPVWDEASEDAQVDALHAAAMAVMDGLLARR